MGALVHGNELEFAIRLAVCLLCGLLIGIERELRGKSAGISTNSFVMAGSALFTFVSLAMDPSSPARVAAQVVSGIGFLGAGMIIKGEGYAVRNLTTAAAVWFAAAIGMAIGFGWYLIAVMASVYATIVPRIPHMKTWRRTEHDE